MTDKEYIIINGKKRDCKILFRCKHIDDTAAYDMMCEGIEIKPENAPVSHSELMLIENTNNPFGFSFICKRNNKNNKEDVWEHSGFGNSGACSIVTALLKQLTCKTQECEELKEKNKVLQKLVSELEYSVQTGIELNARYCNALEEIEEIVNEPCVDAQEDCKHCDNRCEHKDILEIINKAKGERK